VLTAQNPMLNANLKSESCLIDYRSLANAESFVQSPTLNSREFPIPVIENSREISVIPVGTSANAFSYGWGGGQRSIVNVNNDIGTITNMHRMGGTLDPGGYSGDLGYDISSNQGFSWTKMIAVHEADWYLPGVYCGPIDVARYPSHGVYNPNRNTDPDAAYTVHFAPILDCSNDIVWGGYVYGRSKIGNPADSTKHYVSSDTAAGYFQYIPDGFTVTSLGDFWAIDNNINLFEDIWLEELILNHGIWDENMEDFVLEQSKLSCTTEFSDFIPPCNRVEFSPDGQTGYIVVLSDNGSIEISSGRSFYPILYRTEDAGQTWFEPVPVALAGEIGIGGVHNFLTDTELEEIFMGVPPPRDEIEFTTAFDFDLSVDVFGNPHIAVIVGVTGFDAYSIITDVSPSTWKIYSAAFLLSSTDKGEAGSWIGYELGRPVSFRGWYDEGVYEDNRIQIARDQTATKMFVSWLDTDTQVSAENNKPSIWSRGIDIVNHTLTVNANGEPLPDNVTVNTVAQDSAYCFAMGNEALDTGDGTYEMVYVYENMEAFYSNVQYQYIKGFAYADADFQVVGIEDFNIKENAGIRALNIMPNPVSEHATFELTLSKSDIIKIKITNLMGQTVKFLPARKIEAGLNSISIDFSGINPGAYILLVDIGGELVTSKIIVE